VTQRELERQLARATGESISTIRKRGFSLVEIPEPEPHVVDWDEMAANRVAILPPQRQLVRAA
jgi:hypothetical protein